jgi:putative metalloprotease
LIESAEKKAKDILYLSLTRKFKKMKSKTILLSVLLVAFGISKSTAQINLGERALGALQSGMAGLTFSDADAAAISKGAVHKMDSTNVVAGPKDAYTIRLNKIFGKHKNENGLVLNYKVYKTKDVNAFATADGSVRVFSGLMDIMDDNQLLAVIGHEIGHVANHDSRDAMRAAYIKAFGVNIVASQNDKIAAFTDSQYGQIANAILDSKYSRKQESEADDYSYDFMKRNGYNVNAVEAAFTALATMSGGGGADIFSQMMSSHPDPQSRADKAKGKAEADGLYKPYVKNAPKAGGKKPTKKAPTKKKK